MRSRHTDGCEGQSEDETWPVWRSRHPWQASAGMLEPMEEQSDP